MDAQSLFTSMCMVYCGRPAAMNSLQLFADCSDDECKCDNGDCVSNSTVCDGVFNCAEGPGVTLLHWII